MGATPKSNRERWKHVCNETKKCPFCPAHGGENAKKRARPDKYKKTRKGK